AAGHHHNLSMAIELDDLILPAPPPPKPKPSPVSSAPATPSNAAIIAKAAEVSEPNAFDPMPMLSPLYDVSLNRMKADTEQFARNVSDLFLTVSDAPGLDPASGAMSPGGRGDAGSG